jgi:hypothetical protein
VNQPFVETDAKRIRTSVKNEKPWGQGGHNVKKTNREKAKAAVEICTVKAENGSNNRNP